MMRSRPRMVGARVSGANADKLRLLASVTDKSISDIVNIAVDELLTNPSRFLDDAPAEVEELAADHAASVGAAEYYVRRQALILAFQLTSVLLASFASWLTSAGTERRASTGVIYWEPSDDELEQGYDAIGAVMHNAGWILDSWIGGIDYERKLVSEYLRRFTAEDPELAKEYEVLLNKIDSAKIAIEEIVRNSVDHGIEEMVQDEVEQHQE